MPPSTTGSSPASPASTGTQTGSTRLNLVDTKGKQSQSDLPPASLVAMNGPGAFLLAQADTGKVKPDAKADNKSTATTAAKPDVKTDVKPASKAEPKPADKHAAEASSSDEAAPEAPPAAPPVHANLSFNLESSSGTTGNKGAKYEKAHVLSMIEKALDAKNVPTKNYTTVLSNDGDTEVSDNWKVTITPISGRAAVPVTPEIVKAALAAVQAEVAQQPYFPGVDKMGSGCGQGRPVLGMRRTQC